MSLAVAFLLTVRLLWKIRGAVSQKSPSKSVAQEISLLLRMKLKRFKDQNYAKIKKELHERRVMFTDPEFPPNTKSLWYDAPRLPDIEWRRIPTLCHEPKFIVGGGIPNETSVIQGCLGDCWLMAALTAMTRHNRLWKKVIPNSSEQEWDDRRPGAYRGLFRFRFWHFGKW